MQIYWSCFMSLMFCYIQYWLNIWSLGDAQTEEYVKTFELMCKTFEYQSMAVDPGSKVQIESSTGVTKSIVAKEVALTMQNYNQFSNCKFRFMQRDISGSG